MTKKRKRSAGRFALGMIIYALTFIVFLSIGLRLLWGYIDSFEKEECQAEIENLKSYLNSSPKQ